MIITYPNNDAGGRRVIEAIQELEPRSDPNIQIHKSLGRYNYYGFLNICGRSGMGVCVGNSSSGIKETPAFGCPVVNIGSRQQSRLRANNVLDVDYDRDEIIAAVRKTLSDQAFRVQCQECDNPYGKGKAGEQIAKALATTEIGPRLLQKKMTY